MIHFFDVLVGFVVGLVSVFGRSTCSAIRWTRQLFMSATQIRSSDGHARPWIQLNCFGPRPDSPRTPSTVPSSASLYSRPGSESDVYKYCVGPFEMQSVHGAVSSGALAGT